MSFVKRQQDLPAEILAYADAILYYKGEKEIGSIEPGKLADLLILGAEYMTVPEDKIHEIPILKVLVGGKVKYKKNSGRLTRAPDTVTRQYGSRVHPDWMGYSKCHGEIS